jgi:hypothetical protein
MEVSVMNLAIGEAAPCLDGSVVPGVLTVAKDAKLAVELAEIGPNGVIRADYTNRTVQPIDAAISATNMFLHNTVDGKPPNVGISLTDTMSLDVSTRLQIGDDKGGGVPPPSCRIYDAVQVTVSGLLHFAPVSEFIHRSSKALALAGDFENWILDPLHFDLLKGAMLLNGPTETDQDFEVAGINLGATPDGFSVSEPTSCNGVHSNFAIGRLELVGKGEVHFKNGFDNSTNPNDPNDTIEALYVRNLVLNPDAKFTIEGNAYVYYVNLEEGSIVDACVSGCERIQQISCNGGPDKCLPHVNDCPLGACLSGPGGSADPGCQVYDRDADSDVDLFDLALSWTAFH